MAHDSYAALRVRNFRWYVSSHGTMTLATQIQAVVVGWQVYAQTRDPLSLGLIGLAEALPFLSLALYAGHVADIARRKRVAMSALAVMLCCSASLLTFAVMGTVIRPHRVWPIYLVIFVSGIARSFLRPSSMALSAELVPRSIYPNAIAWRSSIWQTAAVGGPAIGGLLYGFVGLQSAYAADFTLMIVALFGFSRIDHDAVRPRGETMRVRDSLLVGIRFVKTQPVILAAMSLDLFSVFFGGATALLPVFASEILKVGPQGLGLLRAAPAAGSVVMSLIVAHRPPMRRAGRTLFASVACFGVAMIAFALSRNFYLSGAALFLSGMADNVSVVIRGTLLQVLTPTAMLGRVSSVNQIFIGSSNEIGAFESGVAARILGTVPSVIFGGLMTLLVVGVVAACVPQLRTLGEIKAEEEPATA